ncbi:MAG: response regulator [Deltaproteobacteria bacterium]|nr:response regulator [Deltaproteobacteria bacterium]
MKKILIVDDNMLIRNITGDILKTLGYEVIDADDGYEGVKKAQKESPDLILMDLNMPGMNGIEAMNKVKEIPGQEKIPVVALTASAKEDEEGKLLGEGFDAYIMKPPAVEVLTNIIEDLLK